MTPFVLPYNFIFPNGIYFSLLLYFIDALQMSISYHVITRFQDNMSTNKSENQDPRKIFRLTCFLSSTINIQRDAPNQCKTFDSEFSSGNLL